MMRAIPCTLSLILAIAACLLTATVEVRALCAARPADDDAELDVDKVAFFEKRIRPILIDHCYECHSAEADPIEGGLRLDSREAAARGGDSGPAVVAGEPGASLLLEAIRYESFEMPPDRKLPPEVIADFEKWIGDGAVDPRVDSTGDTGANGESVDASDHWAFQPITVDASLTQIDQPHEIINRLLARKWREHDLMPAEPADPLTLLRRVYFDLTGLPPTQEEIDAFLADESSHALDALIERLLASPRFGERWGRHWLDAVRYADSSGGGRAILLPHAWRYRDYVIDAFNDDRPYNEFISEQIAGDLMPFASDDQRSQRLTALGFLVLGPTNYELQDKELLRMEVVDEQLDTIGRSMLGLSIGCARCHDHKFDPIPTRDYYALAGILRSTKTLLPGNVSGYVTRELPQSPDLAKAWQDYQAAVKASRDQIAELTNEKKQLSDELDKIHVSYGLSGLTVDEVDDQAQLIGTWQPSTSVNQYVGNNYVHSSEPESKAVYTLVAPRDGEYDVRMSYAAHGNRSHAVRVTLRLPDTELEKTVNQKKPPSIGNLFTSLAKVELSADDTVVVTIHAGDGLGVTIADAAQLAPTKPAGEDGLASEVQNQAADLEARIAEVTANIEQAQASLDQLNKQPPAGPVPVMGVRDEDKTEDFAVCVRGNVHRLGEPVERGFLSRVTEYRTVAIGPDESGRLQLAQWLVGPASELTARVHANRIWHHLTGRGIFMPLDNLGTTCHPPNHPELLDYLAHRLMECGWSTKTLIADIVRSDAYRLSSVGTAQAVANDPSNQYLSRARLRRIDAEALRDTVLAFSGQLDESTGGPAFSFNTKSEFGYQERSHRRSVYLPVFRNAPDDFLGSFDMADPNLVSGGRVGTTLPTQALFLLNSDWVNDRARAAAERLLDEPALSDSKRLEMAFRATMTRLPSDRERQLMLDFLASHLRVSADDDQQIRRERELEAWSVICQALIASLDFRHLN